MTRLPSIAVFWLSLSLLVMITAGCAATKLSENHFKFGEVIPEGETTVEMLELRYSERVEELALRMSRAVATNQDWWFDYLKSHIDDRPLPYHTNFGVSKVEYTEYLDGADKSRQLWKVSDATLIFKRNGDLLGFDIGDPSSPVEKWRLNLSSGKLFTPTGDVNRPTWKTGNDAIQPIGCYEGYSWHYEDGDIKLNNVRLVTLWIYRLKPSGMIFWRMEDSEMRDKQMVRSTDLKFRYDPKQGTANPH